MKRLLFFPHALLTSFAQAQPYVLPLLCDDQSYPDPGCVGTKPFINPISTG